MAQIVGGLGDPPAGCERAVGDGGEVGADGVDVDETCPRPERSDLDRLVGTQQIDAGCDVVPRLDVVDRHRIVDADRAHRFDDELVVWVVHTELRDAVAERIDVLVALGRLWRHIDRRFGDTLTRRIAWQQVGDGISVGHRQLVPVGRAMHHAVLALAHRPTTTIGLTGAANQRS